MLYLVTGNDGRSDAGFFTIIVEADHWAQAKRIAQTHLDERGREELTIESAVSVSNRPIIFSDVEEAR